MNKKRAFIGLILLVIFFLGVVSMPALRHNLLSLSVVRSVLQNYQIEQTYQRLAHSPSPRALWQQAILAEKLHDAAYTNDHFVSFLSSGDPAALELVHSVLAHDPSMATLATQLYPGRSEAWFWLGEARSQSGETEQAIPAYQQAAALDPNAGQAWCILGNLLRGQSRSQARDAYVQCCLNGDPGSNGCFNAGAIEEQWGNIQNAIYYYRLSHWEGSQSQADRLEERLAPVP
jgi:tetratricopeptide (TPR) repeat protein